ncbi:MAG: metalloregulator ArsR/SmtB family transcription factor [Chromatiales bacterium]|jgi:ArsR family transcriptional regulator|nr:metalloregulator ArsR/SmtB family transcription factor [Chromatiales bacterium]
MAKRSRPEGCCDLTAIRPLPKSRERQLAAMLKALADPTRLQILRVVSAQSGPVCACDIVDRFDLSQPTISHHLKVLRDAGLLTSRRKGLWSFYEPDPAGLTSLAELPSLIGG